jgi:hypothetical protein
MGVAWYLTSPSETVKHREVVFIVGTRFGVGGSLFLSARVLIRAAFRSSLR